MSLTLINVSTRRFGRAVRLPEGDVPAPPGSRVFEVGGLAEVCGDVGGAAGRLHGCRSIRAPPSVEIDALHLGYDLVLVDAIGVDGGQQASAGAGGGATENAATVQAMLNAGCSPRQCQDCSSSTARKRCRRDPPHLRFGRRDRCQIHKARNITERLPKEHHAATCRVLRQHWELDADKAEKLIRNIARRLDQQWPGAAATILQGLEES